jgi:hypothetical protein
VRAEPLVVCQRRSLRIAEGLAANKQVERMGIGQTLQQVEGWKGQHERMLRWHGRVLEAGNLSASPDELDFLLAFFESCFHLRDWLLASNAIDQQSLDALFQSSPELRVCRDLANGFKHHSISRPSVDAQFSVVNEYVPKNWPSGNAYPNGRWVVLAGNHQFGLVELASRCIAAWQQFLQSKGLLK